MCGRFILTTPPRRLAEHFDLAEVPELRPRYNVAPTQEIAAVRADAAGARRLDALRWGLVPRWAREPSVGARMINARAETAAEKPAFRDALRRRRCLVPADGFYEWKGHGPERHPLLLRRPDGEPFGIAGLWEEWVSPHGEVVESCALLTTEPNAVVRRIHDRMPALLDPAHYAAWLEPAEREPGALLSLVRPCPDAWLEARPVSDRVNRVDVDDPSCIERAPEPLSLFPE